MPLQLDPTPKEYTFVVQSSKDLTKQIENLERVTDECKMAVTNNIKSLTPKFLRPLLDTFLAKPLMFLLRIKLIEHTGKGFVQVVLTQANYTIAIFTINYR